MARLDLIVLAFAVGLGVGWFGGFWTQTVAPTLGSSAASHAGRFPAAAPDSRILSAASCEDLGSSSAAGFEETVTAVLEDASSATAAMALTDPATTALDADANSTFDPLEFVLVSDLDHSSRMDSDFAPEGQEADAAMELMRAHRHDDGWTWRSFLRRGRLEWDAATATFRVVWGDVRVLHANTGRNGRGMELSEIVKFRHLVFALCDITGIVWKVQVADGTIMPRFALADGNGEKSKPFKSEWATVKDGQLWVGSVGNPLVDATTGAVLSRDSEWVKTIDPNGRVENRDWGEHYRAMLRATGANSTGYMWHEAVEWDPDSRQWFVLPRKRSASEWFRADRDETLGTNKLLIADEMFQSIRVVDVGAVEPEFGFTTLRRVPGHAGVFVALKAKEVNGVTRTKLTVFDVEGRLRLSPEPWIDLGPVKYEGLTFL